MSEHVRPSNRNERDGPPLELLSRRPDDSTAPPLLFVHGAYVGAWCWDEHFLPYVAERGYPAHAVSLRGHGESEGNLNRAGLADYVADVERAVDRLDTDPVLIGHSMGSVVVQQYLRTHTSPAAVLMASSPPQGMAGVSMGFAMRNPFTSWQLSLFQNFGRQFGSTRAMKRALFSDDVDADRLDRYFDQSQRESQRALLELTEPGVARPPDGDRPPTLVLGARDDAIIPTKAVEQTARAHGVEAAFVPDVAHAMMLDTGWQRTADALLAWLDDEVGR